MIGRLCLADNVGECCSEDGCFGCRNCEITIGHMLDEYEEQIKSDEIDEQLKEKKE